MINYVYKLFLLLLICPSLANGQVAGFTADHSSGCAPLVVNFHNTSTGATHYTWNFGNGTPLSFVTDGSSSYSTVGNYTVTLTAYNDVPDSNKFSMVITVYPKPTASFFTLDTAECPGYNIGFTSTSVAGMPGSLTYTWSFGDGNSSTTAAPFNTFVLPGHYSVSLVVANSAGCSSNDTVRDAYIHIFSPATINFSVSDSFFCKTPASAHFLNTTTGSGPLSYTWRFGDGATSSAYSPTHSYSTSGSFQVTQVVTDAHGCKDSAVKTDYIYIGALGAGLTGPVNSCRGFLDTFYNTSSSRISSFWKMGDGYTTTDDAVIHSYSAYGTYTVTLVVFDGSCYDTARRTINIRVPPTGTFVQSARAACDGEITFTASVPAACNVNWLFGDGRTFTGNSCTRIFEGAFCGPPPIIYTAVIDSVFMTVADSIGCANTIRKQDTVYDLESNFIYNDSSNCLPDTINFGINIFSHLYNAVVGHYSCLGTSPWVTLPYPYGIASYRWDFGDGSPPSSLARPTHIYNVVGAYPTSCMIITANGCSITRRDTIKVGSHTIASYTITDTNICPGQVDSMKSTSTGHITNYIWAYGDGHNKTGPDLDTATHVYTTPGRYLVQLITFDGSCPSAEYDRVVTVDSPNAIMHLVYDCIDRSTVTFSSYSYGADSLLWDFGDGSVARATTVIHSFPSEGFFNAKLMTYNTRSGCRDTVSDSLDMRIPADTAYANTSRICEYVQGDTISAGMLRTTLKQIYYRWYVAGAPVDSGFDGGAMVTTYMASSFPERGLIPVMAVMTDNHGCFDTGTYVLTVAKPVDSVGIDPPIGCAPLTVHYTDLSRDVTGVTITQHYWAFGYGDTSSFLGSAAYKVLDTNGTYPVYEIVTDNLGCKDTLSIASAAKALKPYVSFHMTSGIFCAGVNAHFTNTSTGFHRSLWMFGDGDTSGVTSPDHIFTIPGFYTVTLVCFDSLGCSDTFSAGGITVDPSPHSSFYMDDSFAVCPPLTVNFFNTSTGALSSGYKWFFSAIDSSVALEPSRLYATRGLYTIKLVAVNSYGCRDTAVGHVNVFGFPGAFSYVPVHGCSPMTVLFSGSFAGAVTHAVWDFGDGTTDSSSLLDTISHTYNSGSYTPKLILSDTVHSCPTTFSVGANVIKADTLTAAFTALPNPVCQNATIVFHDSSYSRYSADTAWTWAYGSGVTSTIANPGYSYSVVGTYPVTLTVTNEYGCTKSVTKNVTIDPAPSPIGGNLTVCTASPARLTDSVSGGTWSSSASVALTIGSSTGIVTGIAPGTSIVSYRLPGGCYVSAIVSVNTGASPVSGGSGLCIGNSIILADGVSGGRWTSSSPAVATVGSTSGTVAGVTAGTAIITYTLGLTGHCFVTHTISVNAVPTTISAAGRICTGSATALTDAATGGTWISANPAIATVGSSSGVVTGVIPGTVAITYTTGVGCVTTTTINVNNFSPITGTRSTCPGSGTTLANSSTGGAWSSGDPAVAMAGSGSGLVTGVSAGTVIISYTLAGCSAIATYTVNALPDTIIGPENVCLGLTITLADSTAGGTWRSGSSGVAGITSSGVLTGASVGTSIISYTLATGCRVTKTIAVGPLPSAITGDSSVCKGLTGTVTDSRPGGTWSSDNLAVVTVGSGSGMVAGLSAGTARITYNVSGCPISKVFTVWPLPGAITGPDSMCEGGATIHEHDDTLSGAWTSIFVTVDTTGLVTSYGAGVGIVTYTLGTGCFVTKSITVEPVPGLISGASYVCIDSTIILSDATSGGTWSSVGFGVVVTIGSTSGAVTGVSTGTALITYTAPTGCQSTRSIAVNPQPAPVTGPSFVCTGSTSAYSDLSTGGRWSTSLPGIASIGSTTGMVTGIAAGSVIITYAINYLCGPAIVTKMIAVNAMPDAGGIVGDSVVCAGANTILMDTSGGIGTWRIANTSASISHDTVTGILSGIDTVFYSVTNICGTAVAGKSVTVVSMPAVAQIIGDSAVCAGTSVTLSDITPAGVWTSLNAAVSVGTNTGIVTGVRAGTAIISYFISNYCGTAVALHPFLVNPKPDSGQITGDTAVCSGLAAMFSNAAPGGVWSTRYPGVASIDSSGKLLASGPGLDTVYYSVTNVCGTSRSELPIAIHLSPGPVHIITFPDSTLCANSLFQNFGADNAASPGEVYTWSASSGAVIFASSPGRQNCLINFNAPGISVIKLTGGIPGTNCIVSDSIAYPVSSIFTPDPEVVYYEPELVCTDNTAKSYQWGYDDAVTLDSVIFPGEINQNYYNSNLDLANKYYWVITYHNGCIQKSYYNAPLKVSYFTAGNIRIVLYPNPADDKLNVLVQGVSKSDFIDVKLDDILGKELKSISFTEETGSISLKCYPAGVYIVIVSANGVRIGSGSVIKE